MDSINRIQRNPQADCTTVTNNNHRSGLTVIEVMCAITVLAVAVIGTCAYSYHATLDVQRASMRRAASRTAILLCETWRGIKGAETFDPIAYFSSDFPIQQPPEWDGSGQIEADFTMLGMYEVSLDGIPYGVVLSWKDVSSELRALNVVIVWSIGGLGQQEQQKVIRLTSYAPI